MYVRSGTRWHLQASLLDPASKFLDSFGEAVALSGATPVVGGTGVDDFAGAAYVYVRSVSHWRRQAVLPDPHGKANDQFGTSVALSGAQAVIGAPGAHGYDGAVYMYGRVGSRWRRKVVLSVSQRQSPAEGFGSAVVPEPPAAVVLLSGQSVSGLTTERRYQCGFAFEFSRPTGKWRERARVADPKCRSYDEFGYAVAIFGESALIGAPGTNDNSGLAYVLTLLGPG